MLLRGQWHDSVDARLHGETTGEAKRVPNVDDGGTGTWGDEAEFFGSWRPDLETPLFAEEEGEGTDVGVFLVADVFGVYGLGGDVVHHCQGTG